MNNSDLIVRTLEQAGVRWVFGIPSGPVLPLIEALRQSPVDFVLTASETSAAFMASAVGYLTGVPGVCVSTVGPGATNLTTGVGCAWLDRAPLLAITCNVATPWLERRIQMRIDHHKLFEPLTKATFACRHGNVGAMFAEAIVIATQNRRGRCISIFPRMSPRRRRKNLVARKRHQRRLQICRGKLSQRLPRRLKDAKRPLLITGLSFTRSAASQSSAPIRRAATDSLRHDSARQRFLAGEPSKLCRRHRPGAAQRCEKIHRPSRSHHRRRLRSHRDQLRRVGEAGDADRPRQHRSG